MKLFNHEVQDLYNIIINLELVGKKSRMRTRFCKILIERLQEIELERTKLIEKYASRTEDGQLKLKYDENVKNNVYDFDEKEYKKFDLYYVELMNEELIIDETEERKEMLITVRDLILNIEESFSGARALQYDRICEAFEEIKY